MHLIHLAAMLCLVYSTECNCHSRAFLEYKKFGELFLQKSLKELYKKNFENHDLVVWYQSLTKKHNFTSGVNGAATMYFGVLLPYQSGLNALYFHFVLDGGRGVVKISNSTSSNFIDNLRYCDKLPW